MPKQITITSFLCHLLLGAILLAACNDSETTEPAKAYDADTASTVKPHPFDSLAKISPRPIVDTPFRLTDVDTASLANPDPVDNSAKAIEPKASIAYAYKNKMKKGEKELIQMHVQLNMPLEQIEGNLRNTLDEQKARETGRSDTSIIKSLNIAGGKYLLAKVDKYDTAVFMVENIFGDEKQQLRFTNPSKWIWRVTAKKATNKSEIFIVVKTEDSNGVQHMSDIAILPIQIAVAQPYGSTIEKPSSISRYGWALFSAAAVVILVLIAGGLMRRKRIKERNSRIYFSYAWNESNEDSFIDKLYLSLQAAGFNVIRDKANLKYRGLISSFMKDIGKGNIIIVSISDKYLKSRFCMFELYEVYRNCGMSKEAFTKKIFPIREEDINLSDPAIVDSYGDYWKAEELKLEAIVKDVNQEVSSEQFAQYEAVKRIGSELGNLLHFLSDMNSLNIELLAENDFAQIKLSLAEAIKNLNATV